MGRAKSKEYGQSLLTTNHQSYFLTNSMTVLPHPDASTPLSHIVAGSRMAPQRAQDSSSSNLKGLLMMFTIYKSLPSIFLFYMGKFSMSHSSHSEEI